MFLFYLHRFLNLVLICLVTEVVLPVCTGQRSQWLGNKIVYWLCIHSQGLFRPLLTVVRIALYTCGHVMFGKSCGSSVSIILLISLLLYIDWNIITTRKNLQHGVFPAACFWYVCVWRLSTCERQHLKKKKEGGKLIRFMTLFCHGHSTVQVERGSIFTLFRPHANHQTNHLCHMQLLWNRRVWKKMLPYQSCFQQYDW